MAVIQDLLTAVDSATTSIGGSIYSGVAGEVAGIAQVGSVLILALTGINVMIQAVPLTVKNALSIGLRIVLVNIFLSSFANFNAVYGVLTDAPSEVGAIILEAVTGGQVDNLYGGLDGLYSMALDVGNAVSQNGSWIAGALAGLIMFIIAALMAVVSIIMIAGAKLMIGVLIILGPIAVCCTLFKQSAPVFEAYVKLALGYAFVPMLSAAMAGFTILAGREIVPDDLSTIETIGDMVGFIVVMMLGTGLMLMVPTVASSLAQTGIGLGAAAANAQRMGTQTATATGRAVSGGIQAARGQSLASNATTSMKVGHGAVKTAQFLAGRMGK